ncbi:secreted protein containing YkuD domain [Prevotella sp. CAG:755]|nr:secreted protein containing YkuD domain [Prevotella sp. CAG:755]
MPPDHPYEKTQARENNRHFAPLIAKKLVYLHRLVRPKRLHAGQPAEIAQLVEHNLAKVGVASSSLVFRSRRSNGGMVDTRDLKSLGQ